MAARTPDVRDGLRLARGIAWGLTVAVPWWALIVVGLWLLLG